MRHDQTAQIDANGNGVPNEKEDQILARDIIIGRGRVAASLPPSIGSVSDDLTLNGQNSAPLDAFNVASLIQIDRVWAVITPPDYNPEDIDNPVTDLPMLDLTDPDGDGNYHGTYNGFTLKGTYKISIFAKDSDGMFSSPLQTTVNQLVGDTTKATISGSVFGSLGGNNDVIMKNATIYLEGTAHTTTTDDYGNFTLENVEDGLYTLKIEAPGCQPVNHQVSISDAGNVTLELDPLVHYSAEDIGRCDINGDGKTGLPEAIDALKTVVGIE